MLLILTGLYRISYYAARIWEKDHSHNDILEKDKKQKHLQNRLQHPDVLWKLIFKLFMLISLSKIHWGNQRNTLSNTLIVKGDFKEIAQLHSQDILASTKYSMPLRRKHSLSLALLKDLLQNHGY